MSERTSEPKFEDLPVGTRVLAFPGSRDGRAIVTETRSEPWTLPAGDRVVMVEGYAGGIALTHVEVLPSVPPTQPPAAPEGDVRLTDDECGRLVRISIAPDRVFGGPGVDPLLVEVERIVAERARVVEGERDAWKSRRDAAVEQCRHLHQDGKTREQWHLDNCGAMHLIRAVEHIADEWGYISDDEEHPTRYDMWRQLRDTLSTRTFDRDPQRARAESAESELAKVQEELDEHRAHYVDPAAYAELRAGVEALAEDFASNVDWSNGRSNYGDNEAWESAARQARALLGGAS